MTRLVSRGKRQVPGPLGPETAPLGDEGPLGLLGAEGGDGADGALGALGAEGADGGVAADAWAALSPMTAGVM